MIVDTLIALHMVAGCYDACSHRIYSLKIKLPCQWRYLSFGFSSYAQQSLENSTLITTECFSLSQFTFETCKFSKCTLYSTHTQLNVSDYTQ